MPKSSKEKWPTVVKVSQISDSVMGQQFNIYFLSTVLTRSQCKEFLEDLKSLAMQKIDEDDKCYVSALVNQQQLIDLADIYKPRSKTWRGQYYSLANAVVESCGGFTH